MDKTEELGVYSGVRVANTSPLPQCMECQLGVQQSEFSERDGFGYKPRIINKNNAKGMNAYLLVPPESELVMSKLGPVKDYLPVDAPLLVILQ